MSHHHHNQTVPRAATWSVLGLIALTFIAILWTRANDISTTPVALAKVVTERAIRFEDDTSGAVHAFDANTGALIHIIPAQTGHFVRVMLRSMIRERRDNSLSESGAFLVAMREDGQLTLQDSITGRVIVLRAFGETNADAFGHLLKDSNSELSDETVAAH
jgi:putative photosynthetic complex assembly protein